MSEEQVFALRAPLVAVYLRGFLVGFREPNEAELKQWREDLKRRADEIQKMEISHDRSW